MALLSAILGVVAILEPILRLGLLGLLLAPLAVSVPSHPLPVPLSVQVQNVAAQGSFSAKQYILVDGKPFFPVGVSYHFTRHPDRWDDDLQAMHDLGINTVRIDLGWIDVSPFFPGQYQFSVLDDFLNRAWRHGLYVVPVFSHTTQDLNTPIWFWIRYSDWRVASAGGTPALLDLPSVNHPAYRAGMGNYMRATVQHIKMHPALLAYQLLNEPRYDQQRLFDYNPYSMAAFHDWLGQKYGSVGRVNVAWGTAFSSIDDLPAPDEPPSDLQTKSPALRQWSDWRQFEYDNLAGFVGELARTVKRADAGHPVIVSEMAWWWWGEQPYTGVSPLHIYRDADIVGYDLYPDSLEDASYFLLTSDMLARYWGKPVWVMEMNSKDGDPGGEEIQAFASKALDGGATGLFYFEWRDYKQDGGSYGVLDESGRRKPQFGGLASTIRWLKNRGDSVVTASSPKPDVYLVWPSAAVGEVTGSGSPAWDLYRAARMLTEGGLRIGLIAEDVVQAVDPSKLLTLKNGSFLVGKGTSKQQRPSERGSFYSY